MVNISKDLFNFFFILIDSDLQAGCLEFESVTNLIKEKYGKYIENDFDTEKFLQNLKKKEEI